MKKDGGPAFPRPISHDAVTGQITLRRGDSVEYAHEQDGMSLRDYFAAAALRGIISTVAFKNDSVDITSVIDGIRAGGLEAKAAYAYADAMLKARAQ